MAHHKPDFAIRNGSLELIGKAIMVSKPMACDSTKGHGPHEQTPTNPLSELLHAIREARDERSNFLPPLASIP